MSKCSDCALVGVRTLTAAEFLVGSLEFEVLRKPPYTQQIYIIVSSA